jgi:hypothetical protein
MIRVIVLMTLAILLAGCNERGDIARDTPPRPLEVPDHFLRTLNDLQGRVLSDAWSRAYYHAVDPNEQRTTLEGWKQVNGFDSCDRVHVVFRDAKDLGYGRNMQGCMHGDGRVAIFVNNYVVRIFSGDPGNYGPINVEAAILEQDDHMQGTNAIEFSPVDPNDPGSEMVAKFFTFDPAGQRVLSADLDGRGVKPMPQPCLLCHGATLLPWDTQAVLSDSTPWQRAEVLQTLRTTKLNLLELDSFDYSPYQPGYSRSEQEEGLRRLNHMVLSSYQTLASYDDTRPGHWWADFAIEVAQRRYQNNIASEGQTYQDDAVPCGWQVNPALDPDCVGSPDMPVGMRPEGVELLYQQVIDPHCVACHSLRGSEAGQRQGNGIDGNAISFSNYEKFIGYQDLIVDYVYHRGVMPLSLRNYERFWQDRCVGPPALLASFLPDFDRYASDGCVIAPGLPVARPGVSRTLTTPAVLDASASLFARTWQWELVSVPGGASASFSDPASPAPTFFTSQPGDYQVRLTVTNLRGSDSRDITLVVDPLSLPSASAVNFVDHVLPMLTSNFYAGQSQACTDCHTTGQQTSTIGLYRGVPVVYDEPGTVFREVFNRIDVRDPDNSMLLRKPTRDQHGGGKIIDTDTVEGRALRDLLLHWIRSGARCGQDPLVCG